jgi:LPS O-antigen subunit length determinant protein (WzzB/FepE family)
VNNLTSSSQNQDDTSDLNGAEISLLDILRFLKGAYKTILVFGALGLAIAIAYLVITPNRFEAVAQIQMAQTSGANNNNNLNSLGVNIEEPALLIARLSSPSSFSAGAIAACGQQAQSNSALAAVQTIKLAPIKGISNVVELKTVGPTSEAASICAQAIFELIKTSQAQIQAPYLEEAQTRLVEDKSRLDQAKALVAKADKSGAVMGAAAYLSTRDEIKLLSDQMALLQDLISFSQSHVTRLVSPIYASDNPVAPKKRIALLAGLLGGLLLGLLIALGRQMWTKLESQHNEASKVL